MHAKRTYRFILRDLERFWIVAFERIGIGRLFWDVWPSQGCQRTQRRGRVLLCRAFCQGR